MHRYKDSLLFFSVNSLTLLYICGVHCYDSPSIFEWMTFVRLNGEMPFQLRVLPFGIAHIAQFFFPLNEKVVKLIFLSLDILAMTFGTFALVKLCDLLYGKQGRWIIFLVFWWQVAFTYRISHINYYYPYDFIAVGITSVALYLTVRDVHWTFLLSATILAALNRETAIIIPLVYAAYHFKSIRTRIFPIAAMIGACVAIKILISCYFGSFTSSVSFRHEGDLRLLHNFSFFTLKAGSFSTLNTLIAFGGLWLIAFKRGPSRRNDFDTALLTMWPFAAMMAVVGNLFEIRVFGEYIPLMTIVVTGKILPHTRPIILTAPATSTT